MGDRCREYFGPVYAGAKCKMHGYVSFLQISLCVGAGEVAKIFSGGIWAMVLKESSYFEGGHSEWIFLSPSSPSDVSPWGLN